MLRKLTLSLAMLGGALAFASACGSSSDDASDGNASGGSSSDGGSGSNSGTGANGSIGSGGLGFGGNNEAGSGNGTGSNGGMECAKSSQGARLTPANLLFVIDKSGSMKCNPPDQSGDVEAQNAACEKNPVKADPGAPSKWEITRDALQNALDSLVGVDNVSVGVSVFPQNSYCAVTKTGQPDVDIGKLTQSHKDDIDSFLGTVTPDGSTPIMGATLVSYDYLSKQLIDEKLVGNTFVVLLTDGADTCDSSNLTLKQHFLEEDVHNATLFNIRTFVIGAPGSESGRSLLSEVAYQGETQTADACSHNDADASVGDCHFDMTTSDDFAADLAAALTKITSDKTLSCVFDVPTSTNGASVDLDKVNVTFNPSTGKDVNVLKDDTEACDDGAQGWQYSADKTKIVLCGDICDDVKKDSGGEVSIVLGCPTEVVVK